MEDKYVEIIGMVKDDNSVKALTSINLGNNLGQSFHLLVIYNRSLPSRMIAFAGRCVSFLPPTIWLFIHS